MSEEQRQFPWERQEGEPAIWYRRFDRFRLMEPVRSIAAVFQEEDTEKNREKQRNKPNGIWYEIAKQWRWEERAAAWDALVDEEIEKTIQAEKKHVLRKNFALMHKRVQELDRLVKKLIDYTDNEERVWVPDVKAIGNGPDAERVDLVNFNAPLFMSIDKYFKSIAEEVGGRVKKSETTLKSLPKVYIDLDQDEDGSEE